MPAAAFTLVGTLALGATGGVQAPAPQLAVAPRHIESSTSEGFVGTLNELFAPRGLLSDLTRLVERDNLLILGAGITLAATASDDPDEATQRFFAATNRLPGGVSNQFETAGQRSYMYPALIGTYVLGRALDKPGLRRTGAELTQALLLTDFLVVTAKYAAGRSRPDGSSNTSFPSGHTAGYFAIASVLQREYGWKAGVPSFAVSTAMAAARLDKNRHFLSDVIVGAAIGIVVGRSVSSRFQERGFQVAPVSGSQGGMGLGATVRWD